MKKALYGSTALIAAGLLATAVNAQEYGKPISPVTITLGGYMGFWGTVGGGDDAALILTGGGASNAAANAALLNGVPLFTRLTTVGTQQANNFTNAAIGGTLGLGIEDTWVSEAINANAPTRNTHFFRDGEIHFNGRTQLDNGLVVGVNVELEASSCIDQIDRSFVYFDSKDWGRVEAGSTRGVSWNMVPTASSPILGLTIGVNGTQLIGAPVLNSVFGTRTTGNYGGPTTWGNQDGNEREKLVYYTPESWRNRFFGLQFGLQYSPDNQEVGSGRIDEFTGAFDGTTFTANNSTNQSAEMIGVGANIKQKFGDLSIYAGVAYNQTDREATFDATESALFLGLNARSVIGAQANNHINSNRTGSPSNDLIEKSATDYQEFNAALQMEYGPIEFTTMFRWDNQGNQGVNPDAAEVNRCDAGVGAFLLGNGTNCSDALTIHDTDRVDYAVGIIYHGTAAGQRSAYGFGVNVAYTVVGNALRPLSKTFDTRSREETGTDDTALFVNVGGWAFISKGVAFTAGYLFQDWRDDKGLKGFEQTGHAFTVGTILIF